MYAPSSEPLPVNWSLMWMAADGGEVGDVGRDDEVQKVGHVHVGGVDVLDLGWPEVLVSKEG